MLPSKLFEALIAQRRVTSLTIVPHLDVLEQADLGRGPMDRGRGALGWEKCKIPTNYYYNNILLSLQHITCITNLLVLQIALVYTAGKETK
jgi:hypothetical protein